MYAKDPFWSSDILTGNQTFIGKPSSLQVFWSSDILTGNQTKAISDNAPGTLFSIHNHPSNIPPTGSDFAASKARQYAGSIVALHNGDVYYYKHGHSLFNAREFDSSVKNRINKGLDETDAFIATMQEFAERFGIQWKKM